MVWLQQPRQLTWGYDWGMTRLMPLTLAAMMLAAAVLSAAPKFTSAWKSPDAASVSFAGKKVAALVIAQDDSLRVSGEEALVRELTARGLQSVATYRIAPKEELKNPDQRQGMVREGQRRGRRGDAAGQQGQADHLQSRHWVNPYYSTFWGYYGYGWGSMYIPARSSRTPSWSSRRQSTACPRNQLVWAAVSETKNPKDLQRFVEDLVKESVKELHEQGLARNLPK